MPTATVNTVDVLSIHKLSCLLDIPSERLRRAVRNDAILRDHFTNIAGRWVTSSSHVESIRERFETEHQHA